MIILTLFLMETPSLMKFSVDVIQIKEKKTLNDLERSGSGYHSDLVSSFAYSPGSRILTFFLFLVIAKPVWKII